MDLHSSDRDNLEARLIERSGPLRNRSRSAIFLCYHSVHDAGPLYLSLPPSTFERQLATLARAGFLSGDRGALECLTRGEQRRGRYAFITFDDGFADNWFNALPLLQKYGFTAWIFVLPSKLDRGDALDWPEVESWNAEWPGTLRSMTWSQAEALADAGMEIGSHTLSHAHLPSLGEEELRQELLDSRRSIESRLGFCDSIAYPFGEWNPRVAAAAAVAGYTYAFTIPFEAQPQVSSLAIPRIAVDYRDTGWRFRAKLRPVTRRVLLSSAGPRIRRLRPRRARRTNA